MVGKDRDFDEEYAEALACKQKGNEQFVTGDYSHASSYYEEGIQRMEYLHESINIKSGQDEIEDKDEISISHSELLQSISSELSKIYSNDAECSLRIKHYFFAVTQAGNSLKWDETNFKSNFRRAKANVELANYSKAQEDLTYLRSQPSSAQSLREIEMLESEIQRRYDFLYRLIDSYRLRVEDEYLQTGDVDEDTLYSGTCPMPLRHFRAYVRMAMAKANILSSWFDDLKGNNFKIASEIAETHEHYSIRFAQEPSDIMKHYNALGKPSELKALRKLAVKIKGPIIGTGWNYDDEEEGIGIRNYYSAHESDIDDEGNWWQDAPYSPFEDDDDDDEGWGSMFPRFDPSTLERYESGDGSSTRSSSQHQHEESDSDKLVEILLKRKYGEKANGLDSLSFCKIVEDHQLIHTKYVGLPRSMIKDHDTSNPKGKFFDHYGLVAALAVVAFKLLPEEERNSAIIQKRLVDVVYGGEEDILTYHYAYESNDLQSMEEWDGPEKGLTIPGVAKSWNEGEGYHLMQKAWDVWYSLVRARELLDQLKKQEVDFNSNENDDICLLANEASSLPCFSNEALMQLNSSYYGRRLSWDSGLNVFGLYAELALLTSKAHLKLGNYKEALEIALRPFKNASYPSVYQYKQVSKRLQICQAKAHEGLKQYRDAEECLRHVVGISATKKNELPSEEVKKVEMLVEEIKGKRGPFPERQPTAIQEKEGWWYFDASCDVVARNYLMPMQDLTIKVWKQSYPMINKLEIKIEGLYSICGMKDMFPNLEALIVDDSKNEFRIGYDLEELKSYSETLELLRLNLSVQWMLEGSERFAETLSQLTKLKTLSVSHIRDGRDKDLKALEKLTYLESLTYSARNMSWYEYGENGDEGAGTLDLSELTELKSCEFISCMFCAKSEEDEDAQVLILPKQLREITCVYDYRKPSDVLLDELKSMGVTVKCMSYFDWH